MDHTKRSYYPKDTHDDTFANLHLDTLDQLERKATTTTTTGPLDRSMDVLAMAKAWEVAGSTQAWMEDVVRQEDLQLDNYEQIIVGRAQVLPKSITPHAMCGQAACWRKVPTLQVPPTIQPQECAHIFMDGREDAYERTGKRAPTGAEIEGEFQRQVVLCGSATLPMTMERLSWTVVPGRRFPHTDAQKV